MVEATPIPHTPPPLFYAPIPQLDDWPLSRIASASLPMRRSAPAAATATVIGDGAMSKPKLDRLQLTAWTLLRQRPGPDSLASGGTLGGSQGGARLTIM